MTASAITPVVRRVILFGYLPYAALIVWRYFNTHLERSTSHLARFSLETHLQSIGLTAGLAATAALAGLLWAALRSLESRGWMASPCFRLLCVGAIATGVLCALLGPRVLTDLARFIGVAIAFTVYCALHAAFGCRLLTRGPLFRVRLGKPECLLVGWLLGMGLHAVVLFTLGVLMASPALVSPAILLAMAWMGRREIGRFAGAFVFGGRRPSATCTRFETATWWGAFGCVGFGVFFLNFSRVASPAWGFDAMMVHLAAAKSYLVYGGMPFTPQIRSSFMVPLMQCQFTPLLLFFGDLGPKLLEGVYYIALGLATYSLVRRLLPNASRHSACLAALLVCAAPVVMHLAGWCYLGIPTAVLVLVSLGLALRGLRAADASTACARRLGALLGAFLAFTFLAKVQAWAIPLPLGLILIVALLRLPVGERIRGARALLGSLVLVGGVLVAPLVIRNAVEVGNPAFPLLTSLFGTNDDVMSKQEIADLGQSLTGLGMGRTFLDFVALPARFVLHEESFQGGGWMALGLVWLLAMPAMVLGLFRRTLWWVLPFLLSFVIPWFFITQELRYLLHLFPVVALLMASGLSHLRLRNIGVHLTLACLVLLSASIQATGRDLTRGTLSLAGESRDLFMRQRVPGYSALRWLADRTDPDDRIYTQGLEGARYAYDMPANLLGDYFGRYRYSRIFRSSPQEMFRPAEETVKALREFGVRYVAIRQKGSHYEPALLLEADPELAEYMELLTVRAGVFIYEFHPQGGLTPAAAPRRDANILQDSSLSLPEHPQWMITPGPSSTARFDHEAGLVVLPAGSQLSQSAPVRRADAEALYSFSVEARSLGPSTGTLRLQVVWLPEDGWAAKDAAGESLVIVEAVQVAPQTAGLASFSHVAKQSLQADYVQVFLVNDGTSEIELAHPAFSRIELGNAPAR